MPISQAYVGSASIDTTEYSLANNSTSLASITTDGIYQLFLDLSAMTATEVYTLKVKEKVQAASTQRAITTVVFTGVQSDPVYVLPSLILIHGWDITLTKTVGTNRSIEWSIRRIS
jgi:hypothetical protein